MKTLTKRLEVTKFLSVVENGHVTYWFKWYDHSNAVFLTEKKLVDVDADNQPIENFTIQEIIDHKAICCMIIEPQYFTVEITEK